LQNAQGRGKFDNSEIHLQVNGHLVSPVLKAA